MKITREKLRKIILEEFESLEQEQQLDNDSEKIINSKMNSMLSNINALASQVSQQQQQQTKPDGQKIGEAAGLVAFSVALAIPKLLSLAGKLVAKVDGEDAARWFEEAGHKVHHAYIAAIMKVLSLIPQYKRADPKIQKKIAEMVFMGIVGIMLGASVLGATEQLATMSNLPLGVVEGVLSAIKRNELQSYLIAEITSLLRTQA